MTLMPYVIGALAAIVALALWIVGFNLIEAARARKAANRKK